jgi:hypothetical protein
MAAIEAIGMSLNSAKGANAASSSIPAPATRAANPSWLASAAPARDSEATITSFDRTRAMMISTRRRSQEDNAGQMWVANPSGRKATVR